MYLLAYSQAVVGSDDAVRTYDAIAREYPEHPFADDALFFAAELDLRAAEREQERDRIVVAGVAVEQDRSSSHRRPIRAQPKASGRGPGSQCGWPT